MKRFFFLRFMTSSLVLVLFLLPLAIGISYAEPSSYVVSKVVVDKTSDNASHALQLARQEAEYEAFVRLTHRLTAREDWDKLPTPTYATVESFVQSLRVDRQKQSSVRYIAQFTISFDPVLIRGYLNTIKVKFVDARRPPMLVIPLLINKDGSLSFCVQENSWCRAWKSVDLDNALTPFLLSRDSEFKDVDKQSILLKGDESLLNALVQKYSVYGVILARAVLGGDEDSFIYDRYVPGQGFSLSFKQNAPVSISGEFVRQVQLFLERSESAWKDTHVGNMEGRVETMNVVADVIFNNIEEWISLRQSLENIPGVSSFTVEALAVNGASIAFNYQGSKDDLLTSLEGVSVSVDHASSPWIIRSPSFAQRLQPPLKKAASHVDLNAVSTPPLNGGNAKGRDALSSYPQNNTTSQQVSASQQNNTSQQQTPAAAQKTTTMAQTTPSHDGVSDGSISDESVLSKPASSAMTSTSETEGAVAAQGKDTQQDLDAPAKSGDGGFWPHQ